MEILDSEAGNGKEKEERQREGGRRYWMEEFRKGERDVEAKKRIE